MEVKLDLRGLNRFTAIITNTGEAVKKTLKQWAFRYRSFAQQEFVKNSNGGGIWPPLSPTTIARRRGKHIDVKILRDTGTLFAVMAPVFTSQPGAVETFGVFDVTVGYGGGGPHPSSKSGTTIADIAAFHNFGMGHNPKREIIIQPDAATMTAMEDDAQRNLSKEAKTLIG